MVALAIGMAGSRPRPRGAQIARRGGVAAIGATALAAGVMLLVGSRLPVAGSTPASPN